MHLAWPGSSQVELPGLGKPQSVQAKKKIVNLAGHSAACLQSQQRQKTVMSLKPTWDTKGVLG